MPMCKTCDASFYRLPSESHKDRCDECQGLWEAALYLGNTWKCGDPEDLMDDVAEAIRRYHNETD